MAFIEHLQVFCLQYWLCLLLAIVCLRLVFNKYVTALRKIPGPFSAGWTDAWRVFDVLLDAPHQTLIDLHQKTNSPIVRIGPRTISISEPGLIPVIYGVNTLFTKTDYYTTSTLPYKGGFLCGLFSEQDEQLHAQSKRVIASAYSMSTMIEFEPLIDSTTSLFMNRLNGFSDPMTPLQLVDLGTWMQMYAFDVVGEICFSQRLGFLESGNDVQNIMKDIRNLIAYSGVIGQIPFIHKLLTRNPIFPRLVPEHPIVTFTLKHINKRRAREYSVDSKRRDFLTRALEAQEKNSNFVHDDQVLMYNCEVIAAGSDTTGISLRAIFYYLMHNPRVMEQVVDEIDEADKHGLLSDVVSWQQATQLSYLQACIKEALRMHPAVGLLLERKVPRGGAFMSGHFLPEGTTVGINPWVMAQNKSIYGDDAAIFRPERWLEASPEQLLAMERGNLVFGYGARACMGRSISMLIMCKVVPQLLRHYTFDFARPGLEWKVTGGWFTYQDGFEVFVGRRGMRTRADI